MRKGRLCIRKICTKIKMMNNFWMLIFDAAYFFFMHFSFRVTGYSFMSHSTQR